MNEQPVIQTGQLILRPFQIEDAAQVQQLAGDKDIAATTFCIPHPYEDGLAEKWITTHNEKFQKGEEFVFAIVDRNKETLTGAISLAINKDHQRAELGYWIGTPHWNQGYCTLAAKAVLKYGFEFLGLNRIHACHFHENSTSSRVMQKIGMKHEELLRQHGKKAGVFVDLDIYGILKSEYEGKY